METAFLVRLSISTWQGRKLDKAATKEARERANATAKAAVKVYKSVIAADALDRIHQIAGTARIEHRKRTVPWQYDGPGAITADGYPTYKAKMAELEKEFGRAVADFLAAYDTERQAAREYLGNMFNPDDYPALGSIGSKFAFSVIVEPMPQADDFRVKNLPEDDIKAIQMDIAERHADAIDNANNNAWTRVIEHVEKLKLRLESYKPKGPGQDKVEGKFHDSLIDNIKELIGFLPSINVAGDAELTRVGQKLTALTAYSAEDLRESESLRQEIAKQAGTILDQINAAYRKAA